MMCCDCSFGGFHFCNGIFWIFLVYAFVVDFVKSLLKPCPRSSRSTSTSALAKEEVLLPRKDYLKSFGPLEGRFLSGLWCEIVVC